MLLVGVVLSQFNREEFFSYSELLTWDQCFRMGVNIASIHGQAMCKNKVAEPSPRRG